VGRAASSGNATLIATFSSKLFMTLCFVLLFFFQNLYCIWHSWLDLTLHDARYLKRVVSIHTQKRAMSEIVEAMYSVLFASEDCSVQ